MIMRWFKTRDERAAERVARRAAEEQAFTEYHQSMIEEHRLRRMQDDAAERIADQLREKYGDPKDPVLDQVLFNQRMELLEFLTDNNNGSADTEIDDLIQALMEQVNVYHPPDFEVDSLTQQQTNSKAP